MFNKPAIATSVHASVQGVKRTLQAGLVSLMLALPVQAHVPIPLQGKDAVVKEALERYPYVVENPGGGRVVYVLAPVNNSWGKQLHALWPQAKTDGLEIRWISIVSEETPSAADLDFIANVNLKRDLDFLKAGFTPTADRDPAIDETQTPEELAALEKLKDLDGAIAPRVKRHGSLYHETALIWSDGEAMVYYASSEFPESLAELQLILDDIRFNQGAWREFTQNPEHQHH